MTGLPVVVAGGGIAGLSAALALAKAGHDVLVCERDPARTEEGAGLQLSPNASRHLREWGVLDRLAATALAPQAVVVRRASDARQLARLDLSDAEPRWGAPFRLVHRADLHAALREAAAADPRIAVTEGVAVTDWCENDVLTVETSDRAHAANALIVADGVHSRLRERIAPGRLKSSGRTAWRALIPADRVEAFAREPASNLWLGPDAHLVHYPLRGGSVVNVVAIVAGQEMPGSTEQWSGPGNAATLAARFRAWDSRARNLLAAAPSWRTWPLFARSAPRYLARNRVALVGDAAHPMMPFLAQGAAQAIEDASALGAAFIGRTNIIDALRHYEHLRLPRIARVVAASERQAKIYHLRGARGAMRDLAMQASGQFGMRAMTDWIYRA